MAKTKQKIEIALLDALRFVSLAQRARGLDPERYCRLGMRSATAFNGVIAAGIRIDNELQCCPQTARLIAALEECENGYTITHAAFDRLVVQSGQFTADIPLYDPVALQGAWPDAKSIHVDDSLKAALLAVVGVTNEKSDRMHESAVLMQSGNCVATDGNIILEAWHGFDLPPDIILPKAIIVALNKAKKELCGIGYGETTVTFWFPDNSWLRTQRYLAKWPKSTLFDTPTRPIPIPATLFSAAQQLTPFSEDGELYCKDGQASSHPFAKETAFAAQLRVGVPGIDRSRIFKLSSLSAASEFATEYDDRSVANRTFMYGIAPIKLGSKKNEYKAVKMRAVFAHKDETQLPETEPLPVTDSMRNWAAQPLTDDDIPF